MNEEFLWRVEEACFNARPSPVEVRFDGWIIRASGGPTRRTNSTQPTAQRTRDVGGLIETAERVYGAFGRSALFKIPTIADEIDSELASRGYREEGESKVLLASLDEARGESSPAETVSGRASEEWLAAWATIAGPASVDATDALRASTAGIVLPKAFGCRKVDGQPVSIAYGVVHRGLMVVEAVATHDNHQGRGYASQVVGGLMEWGRASGAYHACLSVLAANAPALALYRSLGFDRELYRYHYRRKEPTDWTERKAA